MHIIIIPDNNNINSNILDKIILESNRYSSTINDFITVCSTKTDIKIEITSSSYIRHDSNNSDIHICNNDKNNNKRQKVSTTNDSNKLSSSSLGIFDIRLTPSTTNNR